MKNENSTKFISELLTALALVNWDKRHKLYFEFRQSKTGLYPVIGGTSGKQFYKFSIQGVDYIVIKFPKNGPISEEIFVDFDGGGLNQTEIFIHVHNLLAKFLPYIPEIYGYSIHASVSIIEYLGQESLYTYMQRLPSTEESNSTFQKLIEWLVLLQKITRQEKHLCFQRRMERETVFLEFQEFIKFGVLKGETRGNDELEIKKLTEYFKELSEEIEAIPVTLIHRDYQSKNILLYKNSPWILDFQDACLGPFTYDIASLIYDRKIDLDSCVQEKLMQEFWGKAYPEKPICHYNSFKHYLKLTAISRICKSIGWRSKAAIIKEKQPDFIIDIKPALDSLTSLWVILKLDQKILKTLLKYF